MSESQSSRPDTAGEITQLLDRWAAGDSDAAEPLIDLVYQELRVLARRYLRKERQGHSLAPTGLVHEAYMRLMTSQIEDANLQNRHHFFAIAAQAMRRILVEHARRYRTARRFSPNDRVVIEDERNFPFTDTPTEEILAVDEALDEFRKIQPRQAKVVELRYFVGLTEEDIAKTLGISRATVARDWRIARLMLSRSLGEQTPAEDDSQDED